MVGLMKSRSKSWYIAIQIHALTDQGMIEAGFTLPDVSRLRQCGLHAWKSERLEMSAKIMMTLPHKKCMVDRVESPNLYNCSTPVWIDRHVKLECRKVVGEELEPFRDQLRQVDGSVKWIGMCLYRFLLLPGAAGRDVQLSLGLKRGGIWCFSRFREKWNHREVYPIQ